MWCWSSMENISWKRDIPTKIYFEIVGEELSLMDFIKMRKKVAGRAFRYPQQNYILNNKRNDRKERTTTKFQLQQQQVTIYKEEEV